MVTAHPLFGRRGLVCAWTASLGLLPACASANVPLPTVFAFHLPAWLGTTVFLSLLAGVILIETAALVLLYRRGWVKAFRSVAVANLVSTAAGAVLSCHPFELLGIFTIGLLLLHFANTRFRWSGGKRACLVVGALGFLVLMMIPWPTIPGTVAQFYATLVAAFVLSVLLEAFFLTEPEPAPARPALRRSLGMNAVSYLVLLLLMFTLGFRSGTLPMSDWHLWRLRLLGSQKAQRGAVLARLEEFYLWRKSGSRGAWLASSSTPEVPWDELHMVKTWADQGDITNARELYTLVSAHNPPSPGNTEMWQRAEDSLRAAEQKETR